MVMCVKRIRRHAINKVLENDAHWDLALTKASVSDSPWKHCNLFCNYTKPVSTWQSPTVLDETS